MTARPTALHVPGRQGGPSRSPRLPDYSAGSEGRRYRPLPRGQGRLRATSAEAAVLPEHASAQCQPIDPRGRARPGEGDHLERCIRRLGLRPEEGRDVFAHLKRILGLTRLRLRGPNGAKDEFLMAATVQNLRKPAVTLPASA